VRGEDAERERWGEGEKKGEGKPKKGEWKRGTVPTNCPQRPNCPMKIRD